MKRFARKIISVLMIMQMITLFTWQVFADESIPEDQGTTDVQAENVQPEHQEETLKTGDGAAESPVLTGSAEPADEEISAAPEDSEPADTEIPSVPEEDEPEAQEAAAVPDAAYEPVKESTQSALTAATAPEAAGESTEKAGLSKTITIDGTSIDGSEDGSGNGWNYEKESGRIVLRDYTGSADITSDGTGVEIVSTGFNRIGTLSCDGDINVIGAGILLIDKVELAKDCSFNLLPLQDYYGEDGGSVAVFLLQDDGSYLLVNGSVKGIIDEKVELPEDIRLVLPTGSMLELQAYCVKTETDENGNKTIIRDPSGSDAGEGLYDGSLEAYGGHLLAGDITLNTGAMIQNNNLGEAIVAGVIVAGNLINEGIISGGTVTVVQKDSGSGGLYSGSGTIEDSVVTLRTGQTMSINIKDSTLSLEQGNYTIKHLGLTGSSELYYGGSTEIETIEGASGSSLNIYSYDLNKFAFDRKNNLKFSGAINGADVLIRSGITDLAAGLKFLNGGTVHNQNYGSILFNYSGTGTVSDGTNGSVFLGPEKISVPDPKSIPVVSFYLHKTVNYNWNVSLEENKDEGQGYTKLDAYDATTKNNGQIIYGDLIKTYFPDGLDFLEEGHSIIFEVLRCKEGKLSMTILGDDYERATESDGVFLIRLAYVDPWHNQHGGTSATSTRASQTGTGNIGGNSTSIITGTGITRVLPADPAEPDPEPVKPDPEPVRTDSVNPEPVMTDKYDSVKTAKEYTVAAVTASGDTLSIQVNEFNLNESDTNGENVPYYNLSAYINGAQIRELGGSVKVEMNYVLPEELKGKPLYAVFANEDEASDEILKAVNATYDEETETLIFETSQVGEFVIAAFKFKGEEFSPYFYDELEKMDEIKLFIKHLEENKDNAGL